jgi:hypothetical protein
MESTAPWTALIGQLSMGILRLFEIYELMAFTARLEVLHGQLSTATSMLWKTCEPTAYLPLDMSFKVAKQTRTAARLHSGVRCALFTLE